MDDNLFEESVVNYIEERNYLLRDIPYATVRRAWFTLSHILLDDGARVLDMGCNTGELTYAMAVLYPKVRFVGIDRSKKNINRARTTYKLHNLEFKLGDVTSDLFEAESVDAIINSFILHQVFSNSRYNEKIVSDTLRKQLHMLKNGGIMFIRDYAKPEAGEFVLMEMHDRESKGNSLAGLCEADLLVWYSEHARPKQDPGCGGFFLEELPPRFPKTRLFRLPYKWAYEFIMRKDSREKWENNLPFEYTFYTINEFRNELRGLGARVEYSAPHWDEDFIRKNFTGHFRLLQMDGEPLGEPPTSFIAMARKMPEKSSLRIKERRLSQEKGILQVRAMRDEHTGELVDVVSRNMDLAEILPYRISEEGRLKIYLHDGIARGLANAVSRSGVNIDSREWSGHMVEPIAIDHKEIKKMGEFNAINTEKFSTIVTGMKAVKNSVLEEGPYYYPEPGYIDERVHTFYLNVAKTTGSLPLKNKILQSRHFQAKGVLREFHAQQILDAVAVGLIPNARLELQILSLMQHLNIKAENWISKDISIAQGNITKTFEVREFLRQVSNSDKRFRDVEGTAGQLRTVNSIFVEEGQTQGGYAGISSEEMDFVISDEKTINTAVVLPLTGSMRGDIHAGFLVKHLPIPQRYEGNGMTVSVPQYNIPKEITNYRMLKQFLAEKFGVTPDMVLKLGESYFSHIGMTPHRIHPFAIAAPPSSFKDPNTRFMPMYQYMLLWRSISKEPHFMTTLARAYRYLPAHMKLEAKREAMLIVKEKFRAAQPDWSMPQTAIGSPPKAGAKPDGQDKDKDGKSSHALNPMSKFHLGAIAPKDFAHKKEIEKADRKAKKRLGLILSKGSGMNDETENAEDEDYEVETSSKKKNKISVDLVEAFSREIDDIREAIDEQEHKPNLEKW